MYSDKYPTWFVLFLLLLHLPSSAANAKFWEPKCLSGLVLCLSQKWDIKMAGIVRHTLSNSVGEAIKGTSSMLSNGDLMCDV